MIRLTDKKLKCTTIHKFGLFSLRDHVRIDPEGGQEVRTLFPLEIHKVIGFPGNAGHHKAAKLAFNGGPLSARQRNAISMA